MKAALIGLLVLAAFVPASASKANPIEKIIQMIGDLETKVVKEGEVAQKEYAEYAEWCEDTSKNLQYEIKTGKAQSAELTATIEKAAAEIEAADTKIEELAGSIAATEKDLAEATEVRATEASDFAAERKELTTVIDMLGRAIGILEKEMAKSGASMLQLPQGQNVVQALTVMVQASLISSGDGSKLTALVQSSQQAEADDSDEDEELGAPAGKVYEGHGGGIIDTLNGLLEKAQAQLETAEKKEEAALQNFEMLKQSLTDEIGYANKDKAATEANKEESSETKATAEGDLSVTKADLAEDVKALAELHTECMTHANDFEVETNSRGEELKALATAKKIIQEATGGATAVSYSFVQLGSSSRLSSRADLHSFEAVRFVRELARKKNSRVLAQLASKMNTAAKLGTSESDVFAKIKGLISDMIAKLEKEAEGDKTEKAYCDKETSETTTKKEEHEAELKKLSTKIDQAEAQSAKLKEEVATLQKELADQAKSSAESAKLRTQEKATYDANSADLTQGIDGVKMALKVLQDYYAKDAAHGSSGGAGSGIIGLLEVAQSDFEKDLAEMTQIEETAAAEFEKQTNEDAVTKTMKAQDEKYKTKEFTSLDKHVSELSGDRDGVQTEQDAILEYLSKINDRCIAKAEPYAERKARREAEIEGLKEALEILESETALLQRSSSHTLRGTRRH